MGIANPIPSISSSTNFKELMPITSPFIFTNGPPLFPGLIAASICSTCITKSFVDAILTSTILFLPDKVPLVTVPRYS